MHVWEVASVVNHTDWIELNFWLEGGTSGLQLKLCVPTKDREISGESCALNGKAMSKGTDVKYYKVAHVHKDVYANWNSILLEHSYMLIRHTLN